jgi:hypothetical protein
MALRALWLAWRERGGGNWRGPVPGAAAGRPPAVRRRCKGGVAAPRRRFPFGRNAPARQATQHVTKFSCQVVLSRGQVAPSARGALRAPLKPC